jgi:WD40 repeat protein
MLFLKGSAADTTAFLPNGHTVAFGGEGSVSFWNVQTGDQAAQPLEGLAGGIIAISPDGTMLAASGNSGLQLWDLATRRKIADLPRLTKPWSANIAFAANGDLVVGYTDGDHVLWDLDPADWEARACAVAGRNLTEAEWDQLLPGRPYEQLCPASAIPSDVSMTSPASS